MVCNVIRDGGWRSFPGWFYDKATEMLCFPSLRWFKERGKETKKTSLNVEALHGRDNCGDVGTISVIGVIAANSSTELCGILGIGVGGLSGGKTPGLGRLKIKCVLQIWSCYFGDLRL
jgi:hypothetical protein